MGLSQADFMLFLGSLPLLEPYFNLFSVVSTTGSSALVTFGNLPFEVQLAYPTLACWCEELGEGEGCCEGDNNPRINVSVLVEDNPSEVATAYRQDFCDFVDLVVKELLKVVPTTTEATTTTVAATATTPEASTTTTFTTTTSTTEPTTTTEDTTTTTSTLPSESSTATDATTTTSSTSSSSSSTDSITFTIIGSVTDYSSYFLESNDNNDAPSATTAQDILANSESKKGVMSQLIQSFTTLSMDVLKNKCAAQITQEKSPLPFLIPISTLGKLDTLVKDAACPDGLSYAPPNESCVEFTVTMTPGEDLAQYDLVRSCLEENINTAIDDGQLYNIVKEMDDTKITGLGKPGAGLEYITDGTDETDDKTDKSIVTDENEAVGLSPGFIFLIILALFAMPLIVFAVKRNRERQTEEMARVREFAGEPANDDTTDLENPAAVIPVGAVGKKEEEEKEEEHVDRDGAEDDESSAPSVWSESRGSQVDIVDEENANPTNPMLGSSLAAMGVASAVATNLYEKKNAEEKEETPQLAVMGMGGEEEEKQDLASIQAEVRSLVAKTAPGKTADELLAAYAGKEEELLSHLRRLEREAS